MVVADHQSAGRGRRDRTWVAPGDSLLVSVLLRPPGRVAGAVTMAAGVAMAGDPEQVAGGGAGLKWPNDLVVGTGDRERKLAGILAEADWPAEAPPRPAARPGFPGGRVVVVGVGLNVSWPEVPDELVAGDRAQPRRARGRPGRAGRALPARRGYAALLADGADGLLDRWRARSVTLGRRVRVDLGADVEGTAQDVTAEGHLVVATDEARRTIAVGDVVHLHAPDPASTARGAAVLSRL